MVNILEAVKGATLEYGRSSMEVDRDLKVKKKISVFHSFLLPFHFNNRLGLPLHR
jgi:hypothetical protein